MTHIVDGLLDIAFRTVERRAAADEEIALGIVAALRRLHAAAFESGGETTALRLRAALRDAIIAENLERLRRSRRTPPAVALPALQPGGRFAMAVLEDAVDSCLALQSGGDLVDRASRLLIGRLIDVLGGAPSYGAIVDRVADAREMGQPAALMPTSRQPTMN